MANSDKKIKHFVFIRFFYWQDCNYPYDIYDIVFLTKQLLILKNNALQSLENQTNKNFEFVFILNEKFFGNHKYEFIFQALKYTTTLPMNFIKVNEQSRLVKEAMTKYDFVIQSRIDLDDFIYKDAIKDTQNKINECDNVLAYGYNKGYTYVWGELYPHCWLFRNRGHVGILQSLIWKSSFARNLPFISIFCGHTKIKLVLKEFLEKNGVFFSEKMYQPNESTNAYIYFRHDLSLDQFNKNSHNPIVKPKGKNALTTKDITKKQLKEEFGFYYELNSIK